MQQVGWHRLHGVQLVMHIYMLLNSQCCTTDLLRPYAKVHVVLLHVELLLLELALCTFSQGHPVFALAYILCCLQLHTACTLQCASKHNGYLQACNLKSCANTKLCGQYCSMAHVACKGHRLQPDHGICCCLRMTGMNFCSKLLALMEKKSLRH